ncbi:30S ribosomal protein S8 [Basidiobolus meristosporus CBS 931.73]|uniref:Small ribosomal subunit protein uS8m n=1 Tax=Basidiobolus meristosporus CBS 931.73 TaxID=1314790 RepID=A0A1Y1YWL5_9FUNG|nr:30S ribosomal protein S8 [Basidiobolus meristosporus CBS 931.73]|eukprot:ORY02430.1 30S ribosomal protein S8 [Basidiobolus meristosporus CBS 931.73]
MPRVHDVCSAIQNGFRARLKQISLPDTKMNLAISRILYNQGFVSSVMRGDYNGPNETYVPLTDENIATRRLWLDLKYKDNQPVLRQIQCVSKPSRKIRAQLDELKLLASGKRSGMLKPLQPGEIMIVTTPYGVLELHEAVAKNAGGEILCRAL